MSRKKLSKKTRKRRLIVKIIFVLILFVICFSMFLLFSKKDRAFLENLNYDQSGEITYYDIYGIHMNFNGKFELDDNFNNPKLVLANGNKEEVIDWNLEHQDNNYSFETSEYINGGINLEKLENGKYYLLIKAETKKDDATVYEYFPFTNQTEYDDLTYYTLTKNNSNKKIDISWGHYLTYELLSFNIENAKLPDDVYDITIDPGHDGNDSGKIVCSDVSVPDDMGECMSGTSYKESDLNFTVSKALKEELEKLGYKVKLTRDSKTDTVPTYGEMGSATTANTTKSKFNFALHHNSTNIPGGMSSTYGLEVYVAGDSNFDLAKLLVQNVCKYGNTSTSTKDEFKVKDGIYQRFSDDGITPYYYMIREVGGIATHAYVDGNNEEYDANPYYNSNHTAEGYLLELGYIDNVRELQNILDNPKGYARGIASALDDYLN